jgi:hypothetical protein
MSTNNRLTEEEVGKLLSSSEKGYVKFIKSDGSVRTMHFSRDFSKVKLAGTGGRYNAEQKHITHVIDIDLPEGGNIRAIKWDSIVRLDVSGGTVLWNHKKKAFEYATKKNKTN